MKKLLIGLTLLTSMSSFASVAFEVTGALKTVTGWGGTSYRQVEIKVRGETEVLYINKYTAKEFNDCKYGHYLLIKSSPIAHQNMYALKNVKCED